MYIRFCNGAKLHRADLLSDESHIGLVFTLYRIAVPQAYTPYQIGLLFTHENGDFGAISVTAKV